MDFAVSTVLCILRPGDTHKVVHKLFDSPLVLRYIVMCAFRDGTGLLPVGQCERVKLRSPGGCARAEPRVIM